VLLRFGMKKSLNLLIALQGPQGDWVPAGTALRLQPRGGKAIVGYEGQAFLLDPEPGSLIVVEGGSLACSARLPTRLPASGHIQLGVLRCE
jgi:outer membrane usher protein